MERRVRAATRKKTGGSNDLLERSDIATAIASTIQTAIRWGCSVGVAYFVVQALALLAGKRTDASIIVSFLGELTVSSVVSWAAGAGGVVYGLRQRKLKGDSTERHHKRIKELESMIDPQRSSSNLTSRGETNPEDIA